MQRKSFQEKLDLIASEVKTRDDFVVVGHHDSILGDAEILVEIDGKLLNVRVDNLFERLSARYTKILRRDGKECITPKKIRVFSVNKKGKLKLSSLKAILRNKTNKKIFLVETKFGSVKVTEDHSLISLVDNKLAACRPKSIDFVATPQKYSLKGNFPRELNLLDIGVVKASECCGTFHLSPHSKFKNKMYLRVKIDRTLLAFLGLWLADGCYRKNRGREGVHVSSYKDSECAGIIDSVFRRFGATKTTVIDKGITAVVCNKRLFDFMNYLDFKGDCRTKRLPSWVFGLDEKRLGGLLSGYFSGDGSVSKGDINATTYSYHLAKDLQTALLCLGIRAFIRKDSPGWKLSINDGCGKRIFINKVGFLQKMKNKKIKVSSKKRSKNYYKFDFVPISDDLLIQFRSFLSKRLRDEIRRSIVKHNPLTRYILSKILSEAPLNFKKTIHGLLEFDVFWHKPKINQLPLKNQEVYDIETEEGNFICNNLVLKNSDGICAAAIATKALRRLGKKVQTRIIKQLYPEDIDELKGLSDNFVFVDFGSGQLDVLLKEFQKNFFVLDHHLPLEGIDFEFHLNPNHFGFSGNNEISGSGLSYFFAKALDENNVDLSPLAIVGAVGDMQDSRGKLIGLNAEILQEATSNNFLSMERDLHLYGRVSRPLVQFIYFSSSPILPDLTANEENCQAFLKELGIPLKDGEQWLSYADLSQEQKQKLTTALILHLQSFNVPEWKLQQLIGEVYTLVQEDKKSPLRDAKEFSTLCNSCGRHGQAEVALAVCLGDREEKYQEALGLLQEHRLQLRKGIELMQERGVEEFEQFYFFDAGTDIKDSLVGIVAGMLYSSGLIEASKPIIALGRYEEGVIKVSARATQELVRKGLNLGGVLRKVCLELGGIASAGGHKIAAGCRIAEDQKKEFLDKLGREIKATYN